MVNRVQSKAKGWCETNLALFGSDEDKKVKKESAMKEEAWQPVLCLQGPRLFVWRIEKFNVKPINEKDYGQFYNGDSYIVLNVTLKGRALAYDVHFWIGLESTPDEYGTAAYKTVELDTLLDGIAIQHREVEKYESQLFRSYFPSYRILTGGIDSGFRHVTTNEYQPRLLHFRLENKSHVEMKEVELSRNSLDSGDVYILDTGSKIIQWNGSASNKEERYGAAQFLHTLVGERNGKCKASVLDEINTEDNELFLKMLPDKPVVKSKSYYDSTRCIYKLSDESGHLTFEMVSKNSLLRSVINENDVFFIDTGTAVYVYIGSKCSQSEKQNAMSYAHNYLKNTQHPYVPITVIGSNQTSAELEKCWDRESISSKK